MKVAPGCARDGHEHNQIVYDILKSKNADTLIKSKSMLTEECDTRAFLRSRGITVTETDLGVRIQQLDDEPPSHIVGPAFQKPPKTLLLFFQECTVPIPTTLTRSTLRTLCVSTRAH